MELTRELRVLALNVQEEQVAVVRLRALRHAVRRGRAVRALHVELLRERRAAVAGDAASQRATAGSNCALFLPSEERQSVQNGRKIAAHPALQVCG